MRAVGFDTPGGPEVLRLVELPTPHAGPGEVRVRVHAATVNPGDTMARSGELPLDGWPEPPIVLGMELAGVLDQVGPDTATDLRIGDAVMAMVTPVRSAGGAYAEHVVLPADWVVAAPSGSSHAEAATIPMNGLTAVDILEKLALPPGQTLGVTGAAGAVGGYVVQLAKAAGLRVIVDAWPTDQQLVRSLGADVIVARGDDVANRLRAFAPNGLDALVDTALLGVTKLAPAVCDGGQFARVRRDEDAGTEAWYDPGRGITRVQAWVSDQAGDHDKLEQLRKLAESGTLTPRVARVFPAEQAAEAHRTLEAGGTRGRIVLSLASTP
jgi:NADPH:quinone reductase-like Zn-dependent oxidoreductase